ncbi:MAG: Membrane-associated phospholipid phosphatase [uncultured bacterium]|nr:MAG: Membrane-associated phospholipid phosphatase [uncultured bacterium]HBD05037.1 hypothetical protein [Candidatus Uhrbacteria bacterium]
MKNGFVKFFAVWLVIIQATVAAVFAVFFSQEQNAVANIGAGVMLAMIITVTLQLSIMRPRPYRANHTDSRIGRAMGFSFPSGHATLSFAIATSVFLQNPYWGASLAVLALAISLARVKAQVHYVSDIVGGLIIGIAVPILLSIYA